MTRNLLRRSALVVLAVTAAAGSLAGCASDGPSQANGPIVDITLADYTITPNAVTIGTGVVNLRVTNTGNIEHNLTVGGRGTRNLAPGAQQTVSVDLAAGAYNMWCDVQGHVAMGQTGTLNVAEQAATTAP